MPEDVFSIKNSEGGFKYLPEKVFARTDFEYLLTNGGHLVDNYKEYDGLMSMLTKIGEIEFTVEKYGDGESFRERIPVKSTLDEFDEIIKKHDPNFGMMPYNFIVYGNLNTWGILISEYPTINIIGCIPELSEMFQKIFNIKGNGYSQERDFLRKEWELNSNASNIKDFENNYQLSQ